MERIAISEEMVLSIVWDSEEDPALQEIMDMVNRKYSKNWKPQTVSTFLSRLCRKGYLDMYRKGRHFYYVPTITKEDYLKSELQRLVYTLADNNIQYLKQIIEEL